MMLFLVGLVVGVALVMTTVAGCILWLELQLKLQKPRKRI